MNSWFRVLEAASPAAMTVLVIATVILLAAIVVHRTIRQSPARRHAVMLVALVAVGLCPVIVVVARLAGMVPWIPLPNPIAFDELVSHSQSAVPFQGGDHVLSSRHFPFGGMLLVLWAAGALVGLVRLIRGLHAMSRLRRTARPVLPARIAPLRDRLAAALGRNLPEILASEQIGVPVALGCLRPIVLLPSSFLTRFNDDQLFQMLIHECAHALRRDMLVGFYQRLLAGVLWFHPLIYVANRLLDRAREEVCDNYVLQVVASTEYSRTLLTVAKSLSPLPNGWFAPTLVQSARNLEDRVAGLLNPRRCNMIRLTLKNKAIIATGFIGGVLVLSCFAATPATQDMSDKLSHSVKLGSVSPQSGDKITVEDVRGTSDTLSAGNTYEVKGTYKLVSHDKAVLAIFVTGERSQSGESHPPLADQKIAVEKGEGRFTLRFHMWHDGNPHVSFYPAKSGESFASAYF
jgi:beta-lactamase regulating signal transducer with metallopeptidase domain